MVFVSESTADIFKRHLSSVRNIYPKAYHVITVYYGLKGMGCVYVAVPSVIIMGKEHKSSVYFKALNLDEIEALIPASYKNKSNETFEDTTVICRWY